MLQKEMVHQRVYNASFTLLWLLSMVNQIYIGLQTALRPGLAAGLVESDSTEYVPQCLSEMRQLPTDRHKCAIRWLRNISPPKTLLGIYCSAFDVTN